jgi:hypothetical protein
LRHYNPDSPEAFIKCVKLAVENYCFIRPHHSLGGATPMETYANNIPNLEYAEDMAKARSSRIVENQKARCGTCER